MTIVWFFAVLAGVVACVGAVEKGNLWAALAFATLTLLFAWALSGGAVSRLARRWRER